MAKKKKAAPKKAAKKKAAQKPKRVPIRNKNGECVTDVWDRLFRENEELARKRGQTPLTDAQLVKLVQKAFPEKAKAGKTTVVRSVMMRGCYNKGTGPWLARYQGEVADGENRPISFKYEKGERQEPRPTSSVYQGDADGKPGKKKAGQKKKKAGQKKTAAKKTAAKKTSKPKTEKAPAATAPKKKRVRLRRKRKEAAAA